ncbi:TPA: phosphatase PAP2 family protein, partial [Legionella pneumophila]
LVGFIFLDCVIKRYGSNFSINIETYNYFHTLRNNVITNIGILICLLGDKKVIIPTFGIICLWLLLQKQQRAAFYCSFTIASAVITTYLFKIWVASPRPGDMTSALENFSFPSGHVTLISAYLIFLYALIAPEFQYTKRKLMVFGIIVLIVAEIFARLLLDAHWLTDVVAGLLLGISCGLLGVYGYYQKFKLIKNPKQFIGVVLLTFFIVSCIYMALFYKKMLNEYQIGNGVIGGVSLKTI